MRRLTPGGPGKSVLSALGLALVLAGCDVGSLWPPPPPPPPVVEPVVAADPMPSPPPRKPQPPLGTTQAKLPATNGEGEASPGVAASPGPAPSPAPQQLTALPPPAPAPGLPPAGNLDRLIGLDQPHVAGILGSPRSRAESPPATIWRFGGANCDLDVYFYLDLQSQAMRALHYEVRSHDAPDQSAQRCYETLVNERRANADSATGSDRPR
jgi:hypothetical protein